MKLWAARKKFKLTLLTGEKKLSKDNSYITVFKCNHHKKDKCQFKLSFKRYEENLEDDQEDNEVCYQLFEWNKEHNHALDIYDSANRITPEIEAAILRLKGRCLDDGTLTQEINDTFKTNFRTETIHYQSKRLEKAGNGPPTDDVRILSEGVRILHKNKKGFYKEEIVNNQLKSIFYMSNRMKNLIINFNDVIFLDGTHKSNRFHLPLLDAAIIIMARLAQDSGAYSQIKNKSLIFGRLLNSNIISIMPKLFLLDEEEGLINGKFFISSFDLIIKL